MSRVNVCLNKKVISEQGERCTAELSSDRFVHMRCVVSSQQCLGDGYERIKSYGDAIN